MAGSVSNVDLEAIRSVVVDAPDPDIIDLEARLRVAQLSADVAALDELIHHDLLFTGPDGRFATKAGDLEAHRSGAVRFREHEPHELRVRRLGPDTAVAVLRARLAVEIGGEITAGTYCYTRVWAREDSTVMRVVAGHVSAVPAG